MLPMQKQNLRRPMPGFLWLPDGKDKDEAGPEEVIERNGSYRFSFPESMLSYYLDFPSPRQELANIFISRAWEWIFVISRRTHVSWTQTSLLFARCSLFHTGNLSTPFPTVTKALASFSYQLCFFTSTFIHNTFPSVSGGKCILFSSVSFTSLT